MNVSIDAPALEAGVIPRYRQIEAILRDQICSGELAAGERVPTEEQLVRLFGVSRATVRQALSILEQDSLIYREAGRGTFVNAIVEGLPPRRVGVVLDDLLDASLFSSIALHRTGSIAARGEVQSALGLRYGDEAFFLVRVFHNDGEPVGGEKVYVSPALGRRLSVADMTTPRILETIARHAGRAPVDVEQRIGAIRADARSSVIFKTYSGAPLIAAHRTSRDAAGRPIEHSHMLFRSDRCQICFAQRRQGADGWAVD